MNSDRSPQHSQAPPGGLSLQPDYLAALNYAAGELLTATDWQEKVDGLFERLAPLSGASRIGLYEVRQLPAREPDARLLHQWNTPAGSDRPTQPTSRSSPACFGSPAWQAELSRQCPVTATLADLPLEERSSLHAREIRSVLLAPVFSSGRWWGYLQFESDADPPPWTADQLQALQVIINILGAAVQSQQTGRAVQALLEVEHHQHQLASRLLQVGDRLNATLIIDSILDNILNQLPLLIPFDAAVLLLVVDGRVHVARQRRHERQHPSASALALSWEIASQPALRLMSETRQPLLSSAPGTPPLQLDLPGSAAFRSWLAAPVVVEQEEAAFVILEKEEADFYTSDQASVLAFFTTQAALALRNAQLFAGTLIALEREQHLNQITRTISSAQDLPAILRSIVQQAVELVGADGGLLAILSPDGETLVYPSVDNLPDTLCQEVEEVGDGLARQIIQSGQPVLLKEDAGHPQARPAWCSPDLRATLGVPVTAGNRVLGALGLFSFSENKHFSQRELALVEMVARQAAVAIENVRLYESAQRRAREAEKLHQAVSAVTSALDLDQVLEKILVNLAEVVPYDSSAIFLLDGECVRVHAGRGFPNLAELQQKRYPLDNPLLAEMTAARAPVIIPDAQADPRFQRWGDNGYIHGWMGLPLVARGNLIGYMTIDNRQPGAYDPAQAALVEAFASEVAIAIENARLFQQVQHLAITDPLTGIYNRRYFFEAARRELERARRYNLPLALILLDLDHFKDVNDTYGHLAGDAVLVETARRCQQNLREVDILARYGGEEFAILLPITTLEGALQLAERLRVVLNQPVTYAQVLVLISASQGVTQLSPACPDIQALIEQADQALYHTKHQGRGQVSAWPVDQQE